MWTFECSLVGRSGGAFNSSLSRTGSTDRRHHDPPLTVKATAAKSRISGRRHHPNLPGRAASAAGTMRSRNSVWKCHNPGENKAFRWVRSKPGSHPSASAWERVKLREPRQSAHARSRRWRESYGPRPPVIADKSTQNTRVKLKMSRSKVVLIKVKVI